MVAEALALALLASQTVVAAASTDAWDLAKRGFARLLGRGDAERAAAAERRLDGMAEELAGAAPDELGQARAEQERAWQTRLADLLEEHPDAAAELRALVEEVRAQLPAGAVSAAGHGVAAGRDVNITASGGGVAAATIQGGVSLGNPTGPGPAAP
jgi:hypothetical protein